MGGKLGGSLLSRPSLTLPLFSKIPQDLVNQKSLKNTALKDIFPTAKIFDETTNLFFPDKILLRKSASKLFQVNLAELYVFKYPYFSHKKVCSVLFLNSPVLSSNNSSVSILFYRNGWRINLWWMCVYRMCYQANVLISWSFWLHELYGSDVPFPMISLSHITNAFPSNKMKCLLLGPRNLHFNLFLWPPLLQACDLIFWTIDGNLALFQWPPPPLRIEADVTMTRDQTPPPQHRHQAPGLAETKFASSPHLRHEIFTSTSNNSYYLHTSTK